MRGGAAARRVPRARSAGLTRLLLDPLRGDPLLVARNRRWMREIERSFDRGGGFVAIGLGHLLGDDGVPAMLERAGYRVIREAMAG